MFLAGAAALVLILAGSLFFLFYTDPGRRLTTRLIANALSVEGLTVRLEELGPGFPRHLRLARFTISDRRGAWLSGSGVRISWQPSALLRRRLVVTDLSLEKLVFHRPWQPEEKKAEPKGLPERRFPLKIEVQRLKVTRLTVETPVLGLKEAKDFSVEGRVQIAGATTRTVLSVAGLDGSGDRLHVQGQWDAEKTSLALDATLEEAPGGLLGRLLHLPEQTAIRAELAGRGPLQEVKGRLSLSLSRTATAAADFSADLSRTPRLRISGQGRLEPGLHLAPNLETLVGRQATLALEGHLQGERVLAVDTLKIGTPELQATARLSLNLDGLAVSGALTLNVTDFPRKAAVAGLKVEEGGRLDCRLGGTLLEPEVHVSTRLAKASFQGVSLSSIQLATNLGLTAPLTAGFKGLKAQGEMVLAGRHRPAFGANGEPLALSFQVQSETFRRLVFSRLRLAGPIGEVSAQGTLTVPELSVKALVEARLNDLARLPAVSARALSARALLSLRVEGLLRDPALRLGFAGRLLEPSGLPPYASALIGPVVSFEGEGRWQGKRLDLKRFVGRGKGVLNLSGAVIWDKKLLDLAWTLEAPALMRVWGVEARAPLRVKGVLAGGFERFRLEAEARCETIRAWDEEIRDVVARVEAADLPAKAQGRLEVKARAGARDIQAQARAALAPDRLSFTGLRLSVPGAEIQGQVSVLRPSGLMEGQGLLKARDLSQLGEEFGHRLSGTGEVEVSLHPDRGRQQVAFKAQMQKVCVGQACIQSLQMDVKADGLRDLEGVRASAVLERLRYGGLSLGRAEVQGRRDGPDLRLLATGKGRYLRPFELTVSGTWRVAEARRLLVVESISGTYDRNPLQLLRPMVLEMVNGKGTVSGLDLLLGSGRLTGQADLNGENIGADLKLLQVPLKAAGAFIPIPLSGQVSGNLALSGRLSDPHLEGTLWVYNFLPAEATNVRPLQAKMTLRLAQGRLAVEAQLTDQKGPPGLVKADLPVSFSLRPFSLVVHKDRPMSGSLKTALDLGLLTQLLALDNQVLSGPAQVDLALMGTWGAPRLSGQASLIHGYYEHLRLGILLYDVSVTLRADGQEIVLSDLSATDGEKGRITGQGWLRLDQAWEPSYHMELRLHQAQVVRSDLVTTSGDGRLTLEGTRRSGRLSGSVSFMPTEILLPQHLANQEPEVKVKEVNAGLVINPPVPEPLRRPFDLALDLAAEFPNRFHVRGRGLDATCKGAIRLGGTLSAPKLTGGLTLVRGRFMFLDKPFQLTRGGLTFDGQIPPAPFLEVAGENRQKGIAVMAHLSGPISSLRMTMESDPPLPQDEMLARLLFGRSMAEVSPLQALQLAKAAGELFGAYSWADPGLISRIRQALSVDLVGLHRTETGGTAVGLGASPMEKVYVQAEKEVDAAGYHILVEIELTPHFILQTDLNPITGSGFGLLWKYDY